MLFTILPAYQQSLFCKVFYKGGAIEVPVNLTTVDKPLNITDRFKNTAPDFGVFMLLKIW